jgi:type IV pilus biogenesis protein CpaD/CtpE
MRRWLALAVVVAATGGGAGCRGEQGPVAGELAVRIATPRSGDRAIVFVVTGKLHGVTAPPSSAYRVFADTSANGDTAHVVVVAASGSGVVAGEIARIRVDDVRKATGYLARVIDMAAASYGNGDTSGVSLTVVRP